VTPARPLGCFQSARFAIEQSCRDLDCGACGRGNRMEIIDSGRGALS
jgi:hypothetical protein